jgi:hypothetical protein
MLSPAPYRALLSHAQASAQDIESAAPFSMRWLIGKWPRRLL